MGIIRLITGKSSVKTLDFFARISRVRRLMKQTSCLYEWMLRETYDEQREREMQSISSLLMHMKLIV